MLWVLHGIVRSKIQHVIYHSAALCSELSHPANGGVTWTGRTSGSTAIYFCDSGYQLTGDQTRACNNGIWSGEEPTCTRMKLHNTHTYIISICCTYRYTYVATQCA